MDSENFLLVVAIIAVLISALGLGFTYFNINNFEQNRLTGFAISQISSNTENSAPQINNLTNKILVCEDSSLSYFFNSSDANGDNLSSSIAGFSKVYTQDRRLNFTAYSTEIYSGLLDKSNMGVHDLTLVISDSQVADSRKLNIEVIEINHAPNITYPGVQTIQLGENNLVFNKPVLASDLESGNQNSDNLTFSILNTKLFNITSNGLIYFIINSSFIGVHNLAVCVMDSGLKNVHKNISFCGQDGIRLSSCVNFSITITPENGAPEILSYYPLMINVSVASSMSFYIRKQDPDGTIPDVYWYLDDELKSINSDSYIYQADCGAITKILKVVISDGLLNVSRTWTLNTNNSVCKTGIGETEICIPRFACDEWNQCNLLEEQLKLTEIEKSCKNANWSWQNCGFQKRNCIDINNCNKSVVEESRDCFYTINPNCLDGIKNCHKGKCEILVDCGGPCTQCSTCSDGIMNQNEEGVDCGGQCLVNCIEIPEKQNSLFVEIINSKISIVIICISATLLIWWWVNKVVHQFMLKKLFRAKKKIF